MTEVYEPPALIAVGKFTEVTLGGGSLGEDSSWLTLW
jgi:hypothetical protein